MELLAGTRADVMVVGDDDQTIYEWRDARPNYIIREFAEVFSNKPQVIYRLSHTFRFGPVLAQAAHNVIAFNTTRTEKALTAFDHDAASDVVLRLDRSDAPIEVDHALCDDVQALLESGVPPTQIVVLGRMFSQLHGLEAQFMRRGIPYHVLGARPFLERREVRGLLNYLRVAHDLYSPLTPSLIHQLVDIVNFPGRMIRKSTVEAAAQQALAYGATAASLLATMIGNPAWQLSYRQEQRLDDFRRLLEAANGQMRATPGPAARDLLAWLNEQGGFDRHFDDFYGKGEGSAERKNAVRNLIDYARISALAPLAFVALADRFDPTQGMPEDQQIRLTSIFRTKGLEYDYVILPHCEEGYMPCLYAADVQVFDRTGVVREPEASEALENERRLFYVGITRARKAVIIGASAPPERGESAGAALASRFLEEIQLASVHDILRPLQELRGGAADTRDRLVEGIGRWAGVPWVKRSLIETYLATIGDADLTGSMATMIARAPEQPFAYAQSYPTRATTRQARSGQWAESLPLWLTGGK